MQQLLELILSYYCFNEALDVVIHVETTECSSELMQNGQVSDLGAKFIWVQLLSTSLNCFR